MSKIQVSIFIFLAWFCFIAVMSFTTAFVAFGEEAIGGDGLRRFCYRAFLVFRFPTHCISFIRGVLPEIHHHLLGSSVFYAALLTGLAHWMPRAVSRG